MSDYLDTQVESYQLDEKIAALVKKADKSGMPYSILKKVYDRGMAAWRTGHRPGTTPQQWAFARVNSFVTKSKGTWGGADKDLAAKVRGRKESYEIGADYANHTKEITPGEKPSAKPIDSKDKGIEVKKEDVEKWAFSDETIDKYKKRYAEEWKAKLQEVVQRMLDKI